MKKSSPTLDLMRYMQRQHRAGTLRGYEGAYFIPKAPCARTRLELTRDQDGRPTFSCPKCHWSLTDQRDPLLVLETA